MSEVPLLHRVQLRRRFCHFGAVVILSDSGMSSRAPIKWRPFAPVDGRHAVPLV